MSSEQMKILNEIANKTRNKSRSKEEIYSTFKSAGIIDAKGDLTNQYKNIFDSHK